MLQDFLQGQMRGWRSRLEITQADPTGTKSISDPLFQLLKSGILQEADWEQFFSSGCSSLYLFQ